MNNDIYEINSEIYETASTQEKNDALDAVLTAPEHHRVLFENERVRVVDFRVPSGETVPTHTHKWPNVTYVLSVSDFVGYDVNGNVKVDSRTLEPPIKPGTIMWMPTSSPHSVQNIGDKEIHAISVELKD